MKKSVLGLSLATLALCGFAAVAPAIPTVYLDDDGNDANDGTTPGTAVATLAQAVILVDDGGTIFVAPGVYRQNAQAIAKRVTMEGTAVGDPSAAAFEPVDTTGRPGAEPYSSDPGIIRFQTGGSVIRNLTFRGDNLSTGLPASLPERGGVVTVDNTGTAHALPFTAENCVFERSGGYLLRLANSVLGNVVTNCTFRQAGSSVGTNPSFIDGRALQVGNSAANRASIGVTVTGTVFEDVDRGVNDGQTNNLGRGTATAAPTGTLPTYVISNSTFDNCSYGFICFGQSTQMDITNCDFIGNGFAWGSNGNNVNNTVSTMVLDMDNCTISDTYTAYHFNSIQSGSRLTFADNMVTNSGTVMSIYVYASTKAGGATVTLDGNTWDGVFEPDTFPTSPTNYIAHTMDRDEHSNYNAAQDTPVFPGALEFSYFEIRDSIFLGSPTDTDFDGVPFRQFSQDPQFPAAATPAGVNGFYSHAYYYGNVFDGLNAAVQASQNTTQFSTAPYDRRPINITFGGADYGAGTFSGNTVMNCGAGVIADGYFTNTVIQGNMLGGFQNNGTAVIASKGSQVTLKSSLFRGNTTDIELAQVPGVAYTNINGVPSNTTTSFVIGGVAGHGNVFWDNNPTTRVNPSVLTAPAPTVSHNYLGNHFANENTTGFGASSALLSTGTAYGDISDTTPVAQLDRDADGNYDAFELFNGFAAASTFNGPVSGLTTDTDGDGYVDWFETRWSYDPNDSASVPALGDVTNDGTVDLGDAVRALQIINGTVTPFQNGAQPNFINVTGSTPYNSLNNPLQILRFQNGSRTAFPAVPGIS